MEKEKIYPTPIGVTTECLLRIETRLVYRRGARSSLTYLCGPGELKAEQRELSTAAIDELPERHQGALNCCELSEALQRHLEIKYRTATVSCIKKCLHFCYTGYLRQDLEPMLQSQRALIPSRLAPVYVQF